MAAQSVISVLLAALGGPKVRAGLLPQVLPAQVAERGVARVAADEVVAALLQVELPARHAAREADVEAGVQAVVAAQVLHHVVVGLDLEVPVALVHQPVPALNLLLVEQRARRRPKVVVALDDLAALPTPEGVAVGAHHLVAPLALGDGHAARRALLGGAQHSDHALHLVDEVHLGALPVPGGGPAPVRALLQHLQPRLGRQALLPGVPRVVAQRAEHKEALGALRAVVLVLQYDAVAPGAVHHVLHLIQCALQQQHLPPLKLLLAQHPAHHLGRHLRPAPRVRAPHVLHSAVRDLRARVRGDAAAAKRVAAPQPHALGAQLLVKADRAVHHAAVKHLGLPGRRVAQDGQSNLVCGLHAHAAAEGSRHGCCL
mmetsp:Transcript_28799/g.73416  ORF Transcript_28799/g.73416 Transcript_28799/m.73416 type:complete len:372 (-) Transcript_28799:1396-2511(-)